MKLLFQSAEPPRFDAPRRCDFRFRGLVPPPADTIPQPGDRLRLRIGARFRPVTVTSVTEIHRGRARLILFLRDWSRDRQRDRAGAARRSA